MWSIFYSFELQSYIQGFFQDIVREGVKVFHVHKGANVLRSCIIIICRGDAPTLKEVLTSYALHFNSDSTEPLDWLILFILVFGKEMRRVG